MDRADVQRWLDAYVQAWTTYDPADIGALFAEDAVYSLCIFLPSKAPLIGVSS